MFKKALKIYFIFLLTITLVGCGKLGNITGKVVNVRVSYEDGSLVGCKLVAEFTEDNIDKVGYFIFSRHTSGITNCILSKAGDGIIIIKNNRTMGQNSYHWPDIYATTADVIIKQ